MNRSRRAFLRGVGGAAVLGAVGTAAYGQLRAPAGDGRPTALVAGSLQRVAGRTPGATVEAHGSVAVRRLVVNDLREPDAVALADPRLFAGISDRASLFATNALVVTYDPASEYAAHLERDWASAVQRDGIRLGRTDPDVDPLGYRTVMALRLTERRRGLDASAVLEDARVWPETDLLNVLAGGTLDAAFTYRNMAVQRDLPYVALPDAIDFSNPEYADVYGSVEYDLGERTVRGAPIRYAAAATTDAGEPWVERLVAATDRLHDAGFVVPSTYPRRDVDLEPGGGR